jgi:hypothetical protein
LDTPPRPQAHLRRRASASSSGKARPVVYDPEVVDALRKVWIVMGGPCGKRLGPFFSGIVTALERHGELSLHHEVRAKLIVISAARVDRVLTPDRKRLQLKGRSGTKPGSLLKTQIPRRTFAKWDKTGPGSGRPTWSLTTAALLWASSAKL